jgi:hypothetical protein
MSLRIQGWRAQALPAGAAMARLVRANTLSSAPIATLRSTALTNLVMTTRQRRYISVFAYWHNYRQNKEPGQRIHPTSPGCALPYMDSLGGNWPQPSPSDHNQCGYARTPSMQTAGPGAPAANYRGRYPLLA